MPEQRQLTLEADCTVLEPTTPCMLTVRFVHRSEAVRQVHSAGFEAGLDVRLLLGDPASEEEIGPEVSIEPAGGAAALLDLQPGDRLETTLDLTPHLGVLFLESGQTLELVAEYRPDRTLSLARDGVASEVGDVFLSNPLRLPYLER